MAFSSKEHLKFIQNNCCQQRFLWCSFKIYLKQLAKIIVSKDNIFFEKYTVILF